MKVTITGIFFLNIFFAEHFLMMRSFCVASRPVTFHDMALHILRQLVLYALQKSHKKVPSLSSCGFSDAFCGP